MLPSDALTDHTRQRSCMEQGKKNELLKRLEEHRKGLLHKVHEEEKHIDCLDYLVYQIGRCERKID